MVTSDNWKARLQRRLGGPRAPRVLGPALLRRLTEDGGVSPRSLANWLKQAIEQGDLIHLRRGLYLNGRARPPVALAEAVHHMRPGAVLSLGTVLEETNIIPHSPDREIYALVPIHPGQSPANLGRTQTPLGTVRFHGMPAALLNAGPARDRLTCGRPPRATPEKAILDWLYLGRTGRSTAPALPLEINLSGLQFDRVQRLARAMHLTKAWNTYLSKKQVYDLAPIQAPSSTPIGIPLP